MSRRIQQTVALFLLGLFMGAAGCGSATPARFYTLSDPMPDGIEDAPLGNDVVEILPVSLPELLDRPQVVLYDEGSRVRLLEEDRWAAPLQNEIRQSVAEKVRRLRGMIDVYHAPPHQGESAKGITYRIVVSVESLKIAPGHEATMQAAWTIHAIGTNHSMVCRAAYRTALDAGSVDQAILAYRNAIDALGTRVAASLHDSARRVRDIGAEPGECLTR